MNIYIQIPYISVVTITSYLLQSSGNSSFTSRLDVTVCFLSLQINSDYGFHPYLQRWVIGKRLTRDNDTLYSHGICKNGDQAFLYILSCHAAKLTRQHHLQDQEHRLLDGKIRLGNVSWWPD